MNRPFLRTLAKRAGYAVHQRSTHGGKPAYDWSPKGPMESRHFASEGGAWRDIEETLERKLIEAERLIVLSQEIIREQF